MYEYSDLFMLHLYVDKSSSSLSHEMHLIYNFIYGYFRNLSIQKTFAKINAKKTSFCTKKNQNKPIRFIASCLNDVISENSSCNPIANQLII